MKYMDFIDIRVDLDDNERERFGAAYPEEVETMNPFSERFIQQDLEEGLDKGCPLGEARQLSCSERVLVAHSLDALFD